MKILDSFKIVWRNLWRMKLRTVLTSIGVMIGTAAIVSMISLSIGLQKNAVDSLENFGNLTEMDIQPLRTQNNQRIPPDERKELNWTAVSELKQIEGIEAVMPMMRGDRPEIQFGRLEGNVELVGVDVLEARAFLEEDLKTGEFLSGARNEIVITHSVPESMTDTERQKRMERLRRLQQSRGDASQQGQMLQRMNMQGSNAVNLVDETVTLTLSETIRVDDEANVERKEVKVRVVGQLIEQDNGGQFGRTTVYGPMSLVEEFKQWQQQVGGGTGGRVSFSRGMGMTQRVGGTESQGSNRRRGEDRGEDEVRFDSIMAKVESREQVEGVVESLKEHGYQTYSAARALENINQMFMVIQLILGGIAAISLLVATIGIVNTMIMSILERTREIGIMKVVGATVFNIRWLFLIESGTIGLIGGVTGMGLASGAVTVINQIAKNNPEMNLFGGPGPGGAGEAQAIAVIPLWLALFAIGFSFIIGLLAGIYPAFRASRLSALRAIRTE